jgi:hypothetical protein
MGIGANFSHRKVQNFHRAGTALPMINCVCFVGGFNVR